MFPNSLQQNASARSVSPDFILRPRIIAIGRANSLACEHRPIRARRKPAPHPISGAQIKTSQGKSSLAYTSASPQKAVIIFLGTGWQRFRFRLGRPRAEAHVWGKGARILTEINRLPQRHQLAPAPIRPKLSGDVPL
jgi:hypothetical protein